MTSWDLFFYVLRANFDQVESGYCEVPEAVSGEVTDAYRHGHTVSDVRSGKGGRIEVEYHDLEGNTRSETADLVVGADGPSSTLRKILMPDMKREYAGYVAWRGTVLESEVSEAAKRAFVEKFAFHKKGI